LLCFRQEDAEAFLAQVLCFYTVIRTYIRVHCLCSGGDFFFFLIQVRLRRRELRSQAKVVPITLDQVHF
jgi:hypothetical protein